MSNTFQDQMEKDHTDLIYEIEGGEASMEFRLKISSSRSGKKYYFDLKVIHDHGIYLSLPQNKLGEQNKHDILEKYGDLRNSTDDYTKEIAGLVISTLIDEPQLHNKKLRSYRFSGTGESIKGALNNNIEWILRTVENYENLTADPEENSFMKDAKQIITQEVDKRRGEMIATLEGLKKGKAPQITKALEIAKSEIEKLKAEIEEWKHLALHDELTGIYNRKYFNDSLSKEIERHKRNNLDLSLILFDLDHFKSFNDDFGHDIGDLVLKLVSKIASDNIRLNDVIARWGGEEFIIILPDTSKQDAEEVGEKLRIAIMSIENNAIPRKVTASFGVTTFGEEEDDDKEKIMKRADKALYEAKGKGRNRVEST